MDLNKYWKTHTLVSDLLRWVGKGPKEVTIQEW